MRKGAERKSHRTKGRQLDEAAFAEVEGLLGDAPRRRDLFCCSSSSIALCGDSFKFRLQLALLTNQCRYYIRSGIDARTGLNLNTTVGRQINLDPSSEPDETATLTLPDPLTDLGITNW